MCMFVCFECVNHFSLFYESALCAYCICCQNLWLYEFASCTSCICPFRGVSPTIHCRLYIDTLLRKPTTTDMLPGRRLSFS